jgi:hypothetical protein
MILLTTLQQEIGLKSLAYETLADFGTNAMIDDLSALEATLIEKNLSLQHKDPTQPHPKIS